MCRSSSSVVSKMSSHWGTGKRIILLRNGKLCNVWIAKILALLLGTITGRVKEDILVIIPFMMIRKFSGDIMQKIYGYVWHAPRYYCFCAYWFLVVYLPIRYWCLQHWRQVCNLIIFSPIDHENKVLSIKERKVYQNVTGILTCSLYGVVMIMKYNGLRNEAVCISVGILLTAGLQVPCIVKKFVREWPNSRKNVVWSKMCWNHGNIRDNKTVIDFTND